MEKRKKNTNTHNKLPEEISNAERNEEPNWTQKNGSNEMRLEKAIDSN